MIYIHFTPMKGAFVSDARLRGVTPHVEDFESFLADVGSNQVTSYYLPLVEDTCSLIDALCDGAFLAQAGLHSQPIVESLFLALSDVRAARAEQLGGSGQ